jgi:hypothetical protein
MRIELNDMQTENQELYAELDEVKKERDNLLTKISQMEEHTQKLQKDNQTISHRNKIGEAEAFRKEIEELKQENKQMMKILIKR